MKPVKLSELIEAIEFNSDEYKDWVDRQTGSVVRVDELVISAVEEGDEEALEELAAGDPTEVEMAKVIVADSGDRFLGAPTKFDFHEYHHMERFIGTVEDSAAAEELWRAIKGKGAFRYFKDTARRLDLLKQWYAYREEALKKFARDWAEANEIPIRDDTKSNPGA